MQLHIPPALALQAILYTYPAQAQTNTTPQPIGNAFECSLKSPSKTQCTQRITSTRPSRRYKPSRNLHPLWNTTTLLTLYIHNIGVAFTSTTDTVLLRRVPVGPILVLLPPIPPLLLQRGHKSVRCDAFLGIIPWTVVWRMWYLTCRGVGGTVLDGRVPVTEVAEVVDVFGAEESAGGEGVNGCVAPL